jgi:hypothetical protein
VGSLVTTTSKDSSVGGLGYLSALVYSVTYVDERGELVHLNRWRLCRCRCSCWGGAWPLGCCPRRVSPSCLGDASRRRPPAACAGSQTARRWRTSAAATA